MIPEEHRSSIRRVNTLLAGVSAAGAGNGRAGTSAFRFLWTVCRCSTEYDIECSPVSANQLSAKHMDKQGLLCGLNCTSSSQACRHSSDGSEATVGGEWNATSSTSVSTVPDTFDCYLASMQVGTEFFGSITTLAHQRETARINSRAQLAR
jgi:hypothetical protein